MKVLLLSLFHPELVRGGAQQVCYELFEGLKSEPGVEASLLAAIDPTFTAFYKSGARITGFDGRANEFLYLSRDYDYTWHKTSNDILLESYAEFLTLIKPDVVHFHHFLLFGIDLVTLTRRVLPDVKIVFTLHEFMTMCAANGHLVRQTDQSLCNRASSVRCHQCFPEYGPEHFFLREQWMKKHLSHVDQFATPTRYMIDTFTTWGLPAERITHVSNGQTNCAPSDTMVTERQSRNRFGFFGQFVDAKGIGVLLEAVRRLRADGFTDFTVELNGDNIRYASEERRAEFEAFMAAEAALPPAERIVTLNGSYQVDQLRHRMSRVDWCVVPSTWYETFGLVISEAWMFKRPVIASNVGAIAERVTHEHDGLLFEMGDAGDLAANIRRACLEPGLWQRLSAGITPPPSREQMVRNYVDLYRAAVSG